MGRILWLLFQLLRFSQQILKKEEAIPWPGTLAIVHSYIAYKEGDPEPPPTPFHQTTKAFSSVAKSPSLSVAAKEEEKQKLMKWSSELKLEREQLELRVKQLSNSITVRCRTRRHWVDMEALIINI